MEVDWNRIDLIKNQKDRQTLIREHSSLVTGRLLPTTEELNQRAEIIQALKFMDANYPFACSYDNSERFVRYVSRLRNSKELFAWRGATKIKYNI